MATEFTATQANELAATFRKWCGWDDATPLDIRVDDALRLLAEKLRDEEQSMAVDRNGGPDGFTCLECGRWRPDADAENHSKHAAGCSRFQPTPAPVTGPLGRAVPFSDNTLKDYQRPLAEAIGDAGTGEARTCGYCNGSGAEGADSCPYCEKDAIPPAPLDLAVVLTDERMAEMVKQGRTNYGYTICVSPERLRNYLTDLLTPWLASRSAESAQLAIQEHQRDEAKILKLERDLRTALFFLSRAQLNEFDRRTR